MCRGIWEWESPLASDPNWGARGLLLTDLTGISAAIVAGETFILAQRFGSYLEEEVRRLIVFNDLDTACRWLGVDAAHARVLIHELREDLLHPATSTQTPPTPRT